MASFLPLFRSSQFQPKRARSRLGRGFGAPEFLETRIVFDVEPAGGEFEIPTITTASQSTMVDPVSSGSLDNAWQSVASNGVGDFVVVWTDESDFARAKEVKFRRYNQGGIPLGGEERANSATTQDQSNGAVAMNNEGDFVIVWNSFKQDGSNFGVFGQRFDSDGNKQGGEFRVNTTTLGDQKRPSIAMTDSGDFVVVWESAGQDGSDLGIFAQRFSAAGQKLGGEVFVNGTTLGRQSSPGVAVAGDGSFAVTWESQNVDGSGLAIVARKFDSSGTALGDEFLVNSSTTNDQTSPVIAGNSKGDFVIAWESKDQDKLGGLGVYARGFSGRGFDIFSERLVNETVDRDQRNPAIAMRSSGAFVINWSSQGEDDIDRPEEFGIYARNFTPSGNPDGPIYRVNTTTASNQRYGAVTMDDGGDMVHVWSGFVTEPVSASWGVFGQLYASNQPPIPVLKGPVEVVEGSVLTLDASESFDPNGDSFTIEWDIDGDGVFDDAVGPNPSLTWQELSQLIYNDVLLNDGPSATVPMRIRVSDDGANYITSDAVEFRVVNKPPSIGITAAGTTSEGAIYKITLGKAVDPGVDTVTKIAVDWGDGTPITFVLTDADLEHKYLDGAAGQNTKYTIKINLTDEDGEHIAAGSKEVIVLDVAPSVVVLGDSEIDEGSSYSLSIGPTVDPGVDTITEYRVDWGDGETSSFENEGVFNHKYADGEIQRVIKVSLRNEDGLFTNVAQHKVLVRDVAPTVKIVAAAQAEEGKLFTIEIRPPVDPGQDTVTKYEIDWGDGVVETPTLPLASHTYKDGDLNTNIRIRLTNEDGVFANAGVQPVQILNVAPQIALLGASLASAGVNYTLNLGPITDPAGPQDTVTKWIVYWGDSPTPQVYTSGGAKSHRYATAGSSYTIRVDLQDEDGLHVLAGSKQVEVLSLPSIPGDANLDGIVNFSDFQILRSNFGKVGEWGQGDFDQDTRVAISDFALLRANFGNRASADVLASAPPSNLSKGATPPGGSSNVQAALAIDYALRSVAIASVFDEN